MKLQPNSKVTTNIVLVFEITHSVDDTVKIEIVDGLIEGLCSRLPDGVEFDILKGEEIRPLHPKDTDPLGHNIFKDADEGTQG
jgi:hypothetical protein